MDRNTEVASRGLNLRLLRAVVRPPPEPPKGSSLGQETLAERGWGGVLLDEGPSQVLA